MSRNFEKLLSEAVATERELRRIEQPQNKKMTPEAFVQAACKQAGASIEEIKGLQRKIGPSASAILLRMKRAIAEPATYEPWRHLNHMVSGNEDATIELARAGASVLMLFALAAWEESQENPGVFGSWNGEKGWGVTHRELTKKRDELCRRLETDWEGDDAIMLTSDPKLAAQGFYQLCYASTKGQVLITPDSGRTLVEWVIKNEGKRRVAA